MDTLAKNEIALCELSLAEAIPADLFAHHRTLGELIIIDRVTNMTSACGVVENVSEKESDFTNRASFVRGTLEARGDIFEEFCYDTTNLNVLKYRTVDRTYTVGDEIPIHGESYHYPESFDIIVLRDDTAIKIRHRQVADILTVSEYHTEGFPLINGRGFAIRISSDKEFTEFIRRYRTSDEMEKKELFARYLQFETYRKIIIR